MMEDWREVVDRSGEPSLALASDASSLLTILSSSSSSSSSSMVSTAPTTPQQTASLEAQSSYSQLVHLLSRWRAHLL